LIDERHNNDDLSRGTYESIDSPGGTWVYRRAERTIVALNFSDEPATIDDVKGTIVLCTDRSRDGEEVTGITLDPWTGAILEPTT
jgi:hypothetical protein